MRRWRPGAVDADPELIVLTVLAVLLYAGAAQGWLAAIPGYATVRHTLAGVRWPWLLVSLGEMAAALAGYLLAWRGIAREGVGGGSLAGGSGSRRAARHCERKGKVMATRKPASGVRRAVSTDHGNTSGSTLVGFSERDPCDIRLRWLRGTLTSLGEAHRRGVICNWLQIGRARRRSSPARMPRLPPHRSPWQVPWDAAPAVTGSGVRRIVRQARLGTIAAWPMTRISPLVSGT